MGDREKSLPLTASVAHPISSPGSAQILHIAWV
jgi:hypothetical protein